MMSWIISEHKYNQTKNKYTNEIERLVEFPFKISSLLFFSLAHQVTDTFQKMKPT